MRFSWAENKQVLRFDAAFVSGSNRRPYTSGIYVWDPEAQKLRLVYADAEGSLTDGTVTLENEVLVHELTIKQAHAAPEQIRARLTKSGTDVFTNEIFGQKDGTWTKLVEVRYERAR
jgi:hypothetical protein